MRTLIIYVVLFAAAAWGQSTAPITVTVKTGTVQKIWQFILGSPTSITSFTCTQPADAQTSGAGTTVLMPGDSSTCTVTIVQGAAILAAPTQISITVPAALTLSADPNAPSGVTLNGNTLSIPWATTSGASTAGTFVVTYPATASPAAAIQVWPAAWWDWGGENPPEYYAELLVPCCARADLCGLPLVQVSQTPCQ